jgi:tRNA pseudouridine38-40 synthase
MPRYFIALSYRGTHFSGFQVQDNANTVQAEIEKAMAIFLRKPVALTGSSRTDAGVHARQNFFHFDLEGSFERAWIYNINALLPADIVVNEVYGVSDDAHCRFGATSRSYRYDIYRSKDPFMQDRGWYFPFSIQEEVLHAAAAFIKTQHDFRAFSKRNTQVSNFNCTIYESRWLQGQNSWVYEVEGNRFLRGMVRALVGTMLKMARSGSDIALMQQLFENSIPSSADFSAPAQGLFLMEVKYPSGYLQPLPH